MVSGMIAEIYNKISGDGSNLSDKLEDELTGNFFGTMRYLPYKRGLKKIFDKHACSDWDDNFCSILCSISEEEFEFEFWKRSAIGLGEIDALLVAGGVAVGIEVKLYSDLSGDNQLVREAKMLNEWYDGNVPKLLLFVAPENAVRDVYDKNYKDVEKLGVHLGYISWENILQGLDEVETVNFFEGIMVDDLKDLLHRKGFDSFEDFLVETRVEEDKYYEF